MSNRGVHRLQAQSRISDLFAQNEQERHTPIEFLVAG
jgi:hypothetical protein